MAVTGNPYIAESDVSTPGVGGGRLRFNVAAGAGSGSLIGVSPEMEAGDLVITALEVPAAGSIVDRTATITAVQASGILSSAVTTGNQMLVVWIDRV